MFWIFWLSFFLFLVLWWSYFGYFIFLAVARLCTENPKRKTELTEHPTIAVLVCCHNEENLIEAKFNNLLLMDYPKEKFSVYFLDGNSSDQTIPKLKELAREHSNIQIVETGLTGKIQQLNSILPTLQADYIVNTDVDAELEPNVFKELILDFISEPFLGLAGAVVSPKNSCPEEEQYWRSQNQTRILETQVYSASHVVAPCYMFKKDLLSSFPDDVVADDIYISNLATIKGLKVSYCATALAYELRAPHNSREFFMHKFRKTNAYITEVLRFLHNLPRLNLFWKIIYLTRTLQLLGTFWILTCFTFLLLAMISLGYYKPFLVYGLIGVFSLGLTHAIIGNTNTGLKQKAGDFFVSLKVFTILTGLLLLAAVSFPFYRQNSNYKKLT